MIPKIIIVDDDPVAIQYISRILKDQNFIFESASNGKEALSVLESNEAKSFHILLTDIQMPEMDGKELINIVKKNYPEMISIAMSVDADVEGLLEILNENKAYSYMLKPLEPKRLLSVLERAFEHYNVLQKASVFNENEQKLYQNIMQTFDWRNEIFSRHVTSIAEDIIRQLNMSFSQGEGLGALLTTLSIFFSNASLNGDSAEYKISKELYELMKLNYQSTSKMIQSISNAQTILMEKRKYTSGGSVVDFFQLTEKVQLNLTETLKMKEQKVFIGDFPRNIADKSIIINPEKLSIVITELLINAMKYSDKKRNIYIMYFVKEEFFEVKFLNPAEKNRDGSFGVTTEQERLIFEPFYRISTYLDERFFKIEDFSYGLGLTVIKKIIDLHGASIFIYTVRNLSLQEREYDVCVTLRFPLV